MYNEKDFQHCQFNPLAKKELIKEYPRLLEIVPQDHKGLPYFDNVLRYVCALYDPKSPLIQDAKDLNHRKSIAADVAGFDLENDDEFLQALYQSAMPWPTSLIMKFLMRFIKQRQWAYLVAVELKFWEGVQRIMQPIKKGTDVKEWDELKSIEIKAKISDEVEKDLARLDTLYSKFFGDDENLAKASKNVRVTPEMIASGQNV